MMTRSSPKVPEELCQVNDTETLDLIATLYRVFAEHHEPVARVAYLLDRLARRLEGRFAGEEASGLFVDLGRYSPSHAKAVEMLRQEHDELIARLKKLAQAAANGPPTPEEWGNLEHEFREFGTYWCHHQWRETTTLLDAHESLRNQE